MNKISIGVLVSGILFAMGGCQAFRLLNTLDYPVTISYQKSANSQNVPEQKPQRSYTLAAKEKRDLTVFDDGPGYYIISLSIPGGRVITTQQNVTLAANAQLTALQQPKK